jgi:hypothetical protein
MNATVLPDHHQMLADLIEHGVGLTLAPSSATFPLGGALFHWNRHGWELVWVPTWPQNKLAVHRQPFCQFSMNATGTLSLLDEAGNLRAWLRKLDSRQRRECRWDAWTDLSEATRQSHQFAQGLLQQAVEAQSTVAYRRFGTRV